MPLYIRLVRLTEEGKKDMGKNPGRLADEAGKILEKNGGRRLHTWATMGRYDFIVVIEAPDDKTAMRTSAEIGALGGAHVETLPAIPSDELMGEG
ncbi:MAG: GYD domain-containing protein [Thermoplasmata archaeon]|nr:GYD domain-containing protein [Thermoplasmata archaeon]